MAIVPTAHDSGEDGSVSNMVSTAFLPTADGVVLVFVVQQLEGGGTLAAPTFSFSGSGLPTFTSIRTHQETNRTHSLHRALVGASPTSGQLTITSPAGVLSSMLFSIVEFAGLDVGGTNAADAIVQQKEHIQDSNGVQTLVTLDPFGSSDNRPYAAMVVFSAQNPTPEATWVQLHEEFENAWGNYINTMWKDAVELTPSWAHGAAWSRGFAVELKAAAAAADVGLVFRSPVFGEVT